VKTAPGQFMAGILGRSREPADLLSVETSEEIDMRADIHPARLALSPISFAVLIVILAVVAPNEASMRLAASAQTDAVLPPIGGQGGSQFIARCSQGQHLAGYELLVGDDIDAIRPLCLAAYGPAEVGPIEPYPSSFGGPERDATMTRLLGRLYKRQVICPRDTPVVTGMYVRWEGLKNYTVNNIHLYCGVVAAAQTPSQYPAAVYDGPRAKATEGPFGLGGTGVTADSGRQSCPAGLVAVGINGRSSHLLDSVGLICGAPRVTKTVKPAGRVKIESAPIRVGGQAEDRAGAGDGALSGLGNARLSEIRCRGYSHFGGKSYVFFNIDSRPGPAGETIVTYEMAFSPSPVPAGENSEGLRPGDCSWINRTISDNGPLRIRFETVANAQLKQKLQGVPVDTSPTAAESYPDVNSIPRYLKVESHYWSFGGVSDSGRGYFQAAANGYWKPRAVKLGGKVRVPGTPPIPPMPICDAARAARARGNPAAPGLEARCRAEEAAQAQAPIDLDALAEKGPAIAEQDPLAVELREQQPDDAARRGFDIGMAAAEGQTEWGPGKQRILDSLPGRAEREGFKLATSFSLERNRYAERAALGARIAAEDPTVAEARNAEADPFYQLGFDIATAIFGDKALGAQGNTQTGPGSLKIRDSLSAAGQRGFNDAVKLHLSRKY
jgi:hypothetical protein